MKARLLSLLSLLLLAAPPLCLAGAFDPTEPVIESVQGRTVKVRVPAGFDRVTLQQKVVARKTAAGASVYRWETRGTRYPRGDGRVVSFQLPSLVGKRFLRVFGNRLQSLDQSLLGGISEFLADPLGATGGARVGGSFKGNPSVVSSTGNGGGSLGPSVEDAGAGAGGGSEREVSESDIWKLSGHRLYFFNELRGLQAFDLSNPDQPGLLGTLRMPGAGEEMYLLGQGHAVLLKQSAAWWGFPGPFVLGGLADVNVKMGASISVPAASRSGEVIIASLEKGAPERVARLPYEGQLSESRMVGSVLYLASQVSRPATDTEPASYGVQLTSFDLSDPANPVQRGTLFLGGYASAVSATDRFFMVAKYDTANWNNSIVDLVDISAADGTLVRAGQVKVAGAVQGKFALDVQGGVLTAVAQAWVPADASPGDPAAPEWVPMEPLTKVQTFSIADPNAPAALGSLEVARGESLRAVRFDGPLAYVVTFEQVDPLFVINLKDPAAPAVAGHVEAPGFSTFIQPLGDRLVTVGLVEWRPAVSLFDVADPAAPKLLSQVVLGEKGSWSSSEAVWDEKAFKVLPAQNLILLPVSGSEEESGWFSRVQLIDLLPDSLVARGVIDHAFAPRRATVLDERVVAISATRLVTVDMENRDQPSLRADLEIAWSVDRLFHVGGYLVQVCGPADWPARRAPSVSVSPDNDPEQTLSQLELENVQVIGATVREDVLYLAQGAGYGGWFETFATTGSDGAGEPLLKASAIDLASLPNLRMLGSASAPVRFFSSEVTAHWPSPGILVWAGTGRAWSWTRPVWRPLDGGMTTGTAGGAPVLSNGGFWDADWFSGSTMRLAAFDFTRPGAPKFASLAAVGAYRPWQLSEPVDADGMLFMSYQSLGDVKLNGPADPEDSELARKAGYDPAGADFDPERAGRHYLVRVDYADPSAPVVDDTRIALPGQLRGLARGGQLLFTLGQNYDLLAGTAKSGESALQVSAFDGKAVHLVDTLPLAAAGSPVVIDGETVFVLDAQPAWIWVPQTGDTSGDVTVLNLAGTDALGVRYGGWWWGGSWQANDKTSLLSAWRLGADAHFEKLAEAPAGHATALGLFGGLLVAQENESLELFDASQLPALSPLGSYRFEERWLSIDLSRADGGASSGLWVPLGRYGVETVAD